MLLNDYRDTSLSLCNCNKEIIKNCNQGPLYTHYYDHYEDEQNRDGTVFHWTEKCLTKVRM